MKKKLLFSFILITLISLPLLTNTASGANWWDKFGTPEYGGTLIFRTGSITPSWDTTTFVGAEYISYFESLWFGDWTLDRKVYNFQGFTSEEHYSGLLAESWEQTDPLTTIVHLRQGIKWQDKPPVNGREFTSNDVVEHFNRMMGKGKYTEPQPMYMGRMGNWDSVIATDKYTVVLKLKSPSVLSRMNFLGGSPWNRIEAPEAVEAEGGALKDWKKAVGTGPWMLNNFVSGSAISFVKNPNYWGYDERHPGNRLPYADEFRVLILPDIATAMAAIRTGKIDILGGEKSRSLTYEQAQTLKKSNPELVWTTMLTEADCLNLRVDNKPFSDINVRKALQMAINRPTLAKGFYHDTVDGIPGGIVNPSIKGYAFTYDKWPQELKDEYGYNPELAKKLLTEAGYPDGFNVEVINPDMFPSDILEAIKSQLHDIGVEMEISVMDFGTFHNLATAGKHKHMARWKTSNFVIHGNDYLSGSRMNFGRINDPDLDKLINNVNAAGDLTALKNAVSAMDKHFLSQHYVITTFPVAVFSCWQPYLKGYSGEEMHYTIDQILARCWVDGKMKSSMGR